MQGIRKRAYFAPDDGEQIPRNNAFKCIESVNLNIIAAQALGAQEVCVGPCVADDKEKDQNEETARDTKVPPTPRWSQHRPVRDSFRRSRS